MSRFLKDVNDLNEFKKAVKACKKDVWLRKNDGSEEFNLKSTLSEYIALGRLLEEEGDNYEVFCQSPADESILLKYFYESEKK